MSRYAHKTRPLPPYSEEQEERSGVRARRRTPTGLSEGAYVERNARLNLKVQLAKVVMSQAAQNDPRARLLRIAILRRDEVLLDELLDLGPRDDATELR